ncbi:valine--tRNA ligase [Methylobacterium radiotolerans]|uniref:Valine--tRNA ligase n=2 Tax=Pseudomonadota TaxID=1224 RepID=B1LZC5_METRJ|nr:MULTISPECIES: valine--tRNA ligase [Methylobacterium]ACB27377.1 valyl-tRNA synthetase [Methylobacterium radiotolerans JCM 2831]MDE3747221.1 valine--tRNA ligase [Methylobacterium radiotolerans]PVY93830.1 valyl-tRNA synthetase [Methylobacterium organophilum]UIY41937.1 valine--tRNA ligase [Methylobacterium radiotolerans]
MMDKTFEPTSVEARISAAWAEADAFRAGRPERAGAPPYCIVIPPPNVTGSLHMGHALNNTLQDILCRFERMRGKDVLWQPGTDHAGIATQMVVERRMMERQEPGRREIGRAAFVEKVWAWKAESGGAIVNQLKRLGASCDWSRERFTMDEGLSRAVLKTFVDLHRQGLIYRDKRLVNWDPKFQTAISDLEVQQIETRGHLWHFDYPVVDEAGNETGAVITVATTRPETMLGDTGIAVHPEDARYTALVGQRVRLPLVGRLIPIVADTYSDPEKGTGAVKITPAHDFNDFDVGRRHGLGLINVLDPEGRMQLDGNADFLDGVAPEPEALALHGLDRAQARKEVVALMEARGRLRAIEPNTHAVPHGDRSGVVIEPYLTDQWYVNVKPLAERALQAVRDGQTKFVPENYEKIFFQWLTNIEPWCISRQLWWGHQIPVWYDDEGGIFVAESEEEARAAAEAQRGRPVALTRDADVLDTWFSSALWPFSTLGWPDSTQELARYYPTNTLVTGKDILFFWVARMMMMGLHLTDRAPFETVYLHTLVRDASGAKMSKSKGNVVDPLELIDQVGADVLRFTLCALAVQGRDIKLSTDRVQGYRNFATKLWNAARFAELNGCRLDPAFDPRSATGAINRWALTEAARAVDEVTGALEAFRFNDAAAAAYRFVWNIFCDWYLELAKPVLQGEGVDPAIRAETQASVAFLIDQVAKLLHPFMPFLTEELWAIKGADLPERGLLTLAAWPDLGGLADAAAEAEVGFVVDLVSQIRSARSETNVPAGAQIPLVMVGAAPEVRARAEAWRDTLLRLARLSEITFAETPPKNSVQLLVRGSVAALPLEGVVDLAAEVARLRKEQGKAQGEIKKIDAKLGNADFVARAPEEIIEENRERRESESARLAKIEEALVRLSGD